MITRHFARIYCLENMIDSLKKLAVAVIVLVVGMAALLIYIVNREAKIGEQAQTIERLTASEKVHLEEIDKMKKVNQLYKEQAEKSKKELVQIKKVEIYKNSVLDDRVKKFIENLCYVCECDWK